MVVQPILALLSPEIIGIIAVVAVLLFGADKLPKLARSAGQAKREFMFGQAQGDAAAARVEVPPTPDKDALPG